MTPRVIRNIDWQEFHDIVTCLSDEIEKKRGWEQYDYLYGIPRGGLIPTILLSHMLRVPVITHIEYDVLAENKILVVDDIIDSGKTINKFKKVFDIASVFVKENVKFRPTYWCEAGLVKDNEWIMFPYETETNDPISDVTLDSSKDKVCLNGLPNLLTGYCWGDTKHTYPNCPCPNCKKKREKKLVERLGQ